VATLDGIEAGQLEPRPQPAEGISNAPKLTPDDARVRWNVPAQVVDRQIRACTPAPGAWTMLGDTRLKLWPVRPCPPADAGGGPAPPVPGALAPGELRAGRAGVFAGTATRPVELGDVQPPGKRRMAAAEWARGLHLDRAGAGQPPPAFG
jgi:methionyl-tRNA formyltransferase